MSAMHLEPLRWIACARLSYRLANQGRKSARDLLCGNKSFRSRPPSPRGSHWHFGIVRCERSGTNYREVVGRSSMGACAVVGQVRYC
jgi:hypothetical protein